MTEWEMLTCLITLISFVSIFVGCAWKFAGMITKLETMINNLNSTIEKIEKDQKESTEQLAKRIDEHDNRLRHVENQIIKFGGETI